MTIFGETRLGRIGYAIVLLLMFGFDFGKDPVQRFIMSMHDQAARELMAPRVASGNDQAASGKINGLNMPLMLKGQEDAFRSTIKPGVKPTPADLEKLRAATRQAVLQATLNGADDQNTARLASDRSFYAALYPIAAIAMTGITIVGLLWMVSSRLRDIGWPQLLLWVLLAPVFLPKFVAIPLPLLAVQGINVFFYGVLFILAFIPGQDGRPIFQSRQPAPQPALAKRKPGQFGRLGTE